MCERCVGIRKRERVGEVHEVNRKGNRSDRGKGKGEYRGKKKMRERERGLYKWK